MYLEQSPRHRLALAVDAPSWADALPWVSRLAGQVGWLKIGLELFTREGPSVVHRARELGPAIFLDLKLHDIPETTARAVGSLATTGARLATVHAAGGRAMLTGAVERARGTQLVPVAVTVLTSLDEADLAAQGLPPPAEQAARLAALAWSAGVRSFVSSAAEVGALRALLGPGALLVTPGVRAAAGGAEKTGENVKKQDDQKRIATARAAIEAGSDLLVVGRPLRDASDPVAAAVSLCGEIEAGLRGRA
jgi:orotidine-5'-phosphate decarboxylase